ncbi:extracellular solute-binding protein [Parendozoicomonas haliclonae]|uniref:Putative binding protein component of ABC iron transporter n=1 Tax=Parendozoicomonas haliclonae TaxID=1960125 RepID=A0A1X7AGI4_9GAMM|nr:extracellular solute-binding protein [Parendozoicomonas haliclonae]SMA38895.1 putative binding protein component of ABC iron transporter precursor [Parendozoicomonas haliclonae]
MKAKLALWTTGMLAAAVAAFSVNVSAHSEHEGKAVKSGEQDELVIYTSRKEHLVKPLFEQYTAKTGTQIRYITDKAGPLIARLETEGQNTPADMLITVDAGNLWQASSKNLLQPVESTVLENNIPAHLRSEQKDWYGLSVRARTLVYASDRLKESDLVGYEDLADSRWKGRLCLRTSKKVYNQSLVATMIERLGEEKTEQVVQGWVNNLAAPVFSNDTKAMQAVAAGVCDVTVVNTYYFGRLQKKNPDTNLKVFWANQSAEGENSSGVHVNISGAGVTRHAGNPAGAQAFLEWMSTEEAQRIIADMNMEYPAKADSQPSDVVGSWGEFRADDLNVAAAGAKQARAIQLMDKVSYK